MADTKTPLEEDRFYHIYNHAVGSDILFTKDNNYLYFLQLFSKYLSNFVEVYAYCLLPNHFHFIIKVKSFDEINKNLMKEQYEALRGLQTTHGASNEINIATTISKQFSHFFNSYAQAFNKQENRKGSLLNNRFKRKQVTDDTYLLKLIHYIHYNPVEANLCSKISDWRYSSYNAILSDKNTLVVRDKVIELFGDKQNFIYCHTIEPTISGFD